MSNLDDKMNNKLYHFQLTLHQRNRPLDITVYEKATLALTDDYENVRLAAIKLVWVFSHTTPNRFVCRFVLCFLKEFAREKVAVLLRQCC